MVMATETSRRLRIGVRVRDMVVLLRMAILGSPDLREAL